jgi:uncharacterized protein (DUF58 family)
MIDTSFLKQLDRFSLVIRKRVTSSYAGPRRSVAFGRGLTFREHRIYAPGDDIRSVDWRVFARTDDLYVKMYEEERNLVLHTILDSSRSMDFGKNISKFDYGAMLCVGFAYLAMKENEKVQFSTFSDNLDVFRRRKGRSQLAAMTYTLNHLKLGGSSNLKESLIMYKKYVTSSSLVVLVSDFLVSIEEIRVALNLFADHELKVIQVLDPIEKDLKFEGDFNLKDSETGLKLKTNISPKVREVYQTMIGDHSSKIEDECNKMGAGFHLITTNTPIFDAFYKILK